MACALQDEIPFRCTAAAFPPLACPVMTRLPHQIQNAFSTYADTHVQPSGGFDGYNSETTGSIEALLWKHNSDIRGLVEGKGVGVGPYRTTGTGEGHALMYSIRRSVACQYPPIYPPLRCRVRPRAMAR